MAAKSGKSSPLFISASIEFKNQSRDYINQSFEELLVNEPFSDDELLNGGAAQQDFDK